MAFFSSLPRLAGSLTRTISRRALLAAPAAFAQTNLLEITHEIFARSPARGSAVMAYAFYTRPSGGEMIAIEERWSRSDTIDSAFIRRSRDYGHTWSQPEVRITGERRAQ